MANKLTEIQFLFTNGKYIRGNHFYTVFSVIRTGFLILYSPEDCSGIPILQIDVPWRDINCHVPRFPLQILHYVSDCAVAHI